jgi:hypothetical protein
MGEALGIQGRRPMSSALLPGPALRDEDTFLAGAQGSTGKSYAGRNGDRRHAVFRPQPVVLANRAEQAWFHLTTSRVSVSNLECVAINARDLFFATV